MRAWLVAACALLVPAAIGCAALIGADFDAHLVAAAEGGSDAGSEGPDTGCAHARVPPNVARGQNLGGTKEAWFALYALDYGDGDGIPDAAHYGSIGYDIDRTCTGQGEAPTCVQGPHAGVDGKDGRDNAAGELLFEVKSTYKLLAATIGSTADTQQIQRGGFSILFHLTGYNGAADDDQVRVEWYAPAGFAADKPLPDGGKAMPRWDGTDQWPLRRAELDLPADGGYMARAFDDGAYVAGYVLVAAPPRGTSIRGGSIDINLEGVFVTGTLVNDAGGGAYELKDGVLAGTWRAQQVFAGLAPFLGKLGLCTDAQLYQDMKILVCGALDVSSAGVPLPTASCDALSIGVAFSAKPVRKPVVIVDASVPPVVCAPDKDPRNDTCVKDGG
jgi:hypothetical protein